MGNYKRLTTEDPQGNMENMLNMTKVINKEVYIRDLNGEGDISLVDFCKSEYKRIYGTEIDANAEDFGEYMDDDSILSLFYLMAVGHAELRLRLEKYEDSGLSPEEVEHTKTALKLAKETLKKVQWMDKSYMHIQYCRTCSRWPEIFHSNYCEIKKTLDAIDRVIGGDGK